MESSQTPEFVRELTQFYRDSRVLVSKCKKPNYDEFAKIAYATGLGKLNLFTAVHLFTAIHLFTAMHLFTSVHLFTSIRLFTAVHLFIY